MELKEYEYYGLLASSWDLLRGDTADWPDRPFFREIIEDNGQPALDVGCGTGRLILDYLADGLDVDGVDVSPEMLEICHRKAEELSLKPNLYQQTMESLQLPRHYATIFVTSSSFQLVTEPADAFQSLRNFYQHLLPGGLLVMSIMEFEEGSGEWIQIAQALRPEDGLLLKRWERAHYDHAAQLRYTENRYELLKDDEIVYTERHTRSPEFRGYTLAQISKLLEDAEFINIRAVSGFSFEPASADDSMFCIFGERP